MLAMRGTRSDKAKITGKMKKQQNMFLKNVFTNLTGRTGCFY